MDANELTDEQLLAIVAEADKELFASGVTIERRYWEVSNVIMKKLGYVGYVMSGRGKPRILERIESAYKSIYRPNALLGAGYIGIYMYRDVFARISIPFVFGTVSLRPLDFIDLTEVQLRTLETEHEEFHRYCDQFCDVLDIHLGVNELKKDIDNSDLVRRFIDLARLHLHAAAGILSGGYDYRGAVQSAILGTELALKSGVAAQGFSENKIKNTFGHDLQGLSSSVSQRMDSFDHTRVSRVLNQQPKYVFNRYSAEQPSRISVGHIVMGAQFVVSEIVRQLSNRNSRSDMKPTIERHYPA